MSLNADQRNVVDHDGHVLVVACPGAGKTRVLTAKIGALLSRHPRAKICAVTFTRDAARELQHRTTKEIGETAFKRHCSVGTFHSLAIKQLRNANLIGKVASPQEQRSYLRRAMALAAPEMSYEEAVYLIEQAKTTFGACPEKESPLYHAYTELLARSKVEDLYDVLRRSVELMRSGELSPMPVHFMLVDEFQDTDRIQLEWVMLHVEAGTNVTVVGDDDQAIYGFRGSLGYDGMTMFAKRAKAITITLAINYRCRAEILSAAATLISHNDARVAKQLFAARGPGGTIVSKRYASRHDEAISLAKTILAESIPNAAGTTHGVSRTVPAGAWSVLSRNRFLLDEVEAALIAAGIKYRRSAGESIWARSPFVQILGLLRSIQTGDADGIEHALQHALAIKIGHVSAEAAIREIHQQLGSNLYRLLDGACIQTERLSPPAADIVRAFSARGVGWRKLARDGKYAMIVLGVADWFASFEERENNQDLVRNVGSAAAKLRGTLVQRAQTLSSPNESKNDEADDGVALYTMHSSKSLEFSNVWIVGCDAGVIPSPKNDNYPEERRLMYVAMTRAKDTLHLSSVIGGDPSPFLVESNTLPS